MILKIREVHEYRVDIDYLASNFVHEDLDDYINEPTLEDINDFLEFELKEEFYDYKKGKTMDYNYILPKDKEKLLNLFIEAVNKLLREEGKDELDL